MTQIIRGTTPTIIFTFAHVPVGNISTAVFTIKQYGELIIEKDKTDSTVGEKTLSWSLSQEESLSLSEGFCTIMLNWLLADGTRGASRENIVEIITNHILEVIV
jgi:hypothetical protein